MRTFYGPHRCLFLQCLSLEGYFEKLFHSCNALNNILCSRHSQGVHSAFKSAVFNFVCVCFYGNKVFQFRIHFHDFVNTGSAVEAGFGAHRASAGFVNCERLVGVYAEDFFFISRCLSGLFSMRAEFSDKSLGYDTDNRVGNKIGFDAHIKKSRYCCSRRVCMECGNNQVAGDRCLNGD